MEYVVNMHFDPCAGSWRATIMHDGGMVTATNRTLLSTLDTIREALGAWLGDFDASDQAVLLPRFERLLSP